MNFIFFSSFAVLTSLGTHLKRLEHDGFFLEDIHIHFGYHFWIVPNRYWGPTCTICLTACHINLIWILSFIWQRKISEVWRTTSNKIFQRFLTKRALRIISILRRSVRNNFMQTYTCVQYQCSDQCRYERFYIKTYYYDHYQAAIY